MISVICSVFVGEVQHGLFQKCDYNGMFGIIMAFQYFSVKKRFLIAEEEVTRPNQNQWILIAYMFVSFSGERSFGVVLYSLRDPKWRFWRFPVLYCMLAHTFTPQPIKVSEGFGNQIESDSIRAQNFNTSHGQACWNISESTVSKKWLFCWCKHL